MRVRAPLSGAQADRHCWVHWCGCEWLRRSPGYVADLLDLTQKYECEQTSSAPLFLFPRELWDWDQWTTDLLKARNQWLPLWGWCEYISQHWTGCVTFSPIKSWWFFKCLCASLLSHPKDYGCYPKSPWWPAGGEDHQEPASMCHPLKFHHLTLHFWL